MIDCDRGRISAYYDGELPEWERHRVGRHLASCPQCGRALAEYRAIGSGIRSLPDVAPPALIRARVFSRAVRGETRRVGRVVGGAAAFGGLATVAAVFVMMLAALATDLPSRWGPVTAPPDQRAAVTVTPAAVVARAQPTLAPAPAGEEGSQRAAPKPPAASPAGAVAPPAAPARPTTATAPAVGPTPAAAPAPTARPTVGPTAPSSTPPAPAPTAIAVAQATVSPTPGGIRLLGVEPSATLTATAPITVTGVISEVAKGQPLLRLRGDDGAEWRVDLQAAETITRTDGLPVAVGDLRPGLRVGITGRPGGQIRSLIARLVTVFATEAPR